MNATLPVRSRASFLQFAVIIVAQTIAPQASAQFSWDGECGFNWYDCCNYGTDENPDFRNNWTISPNSTTCPNLPGSADDVYASTTVLLAQPYQTFVKSLSVTGTFMLRSELDIADSLMINGTPTEPTNVLLQNGPADSIQLRNDNATVTISSFATLDFQFDGQVVGPATSLLTNNGVILKSVGGDDQPPYEALSALNIPWENDGTIKATDGRLVFFGSGTNNGVIEALGEAEVRFQGNAELDGEVRGDGLVRFVYSQTTVTGDYHPTNTLIAGGGARVDFEVDTSVENLTLGNPCTIGGSADLTIDDLLWNGGYSSMTGIGTTTVQETMLIQHDTFAGGAFTINRDMELQGDSVIQGSAQVYIDDCELTNQGELQLQGNTSMAQPCCVPDSVIQNFGTLRKASGAQSVINVAFLNAGDIAIESGDLNFDGAMESSGPITVNTGTTLLLGHNLQAIQSTGSITGDGSVFFYNDFWSGDTTVDSIQGEYNVGATTIQAGTMSFDTDGVIAAQKTTGILNLIQGFGATKLQGNADLIVTNQLNWSAGEMAGTGRTLAYGPLILTGSGTLNRMLELNVSPPPPKDPPSWTFSIGSLGTLHGFDVTIDGHASNSGVISPGTVNAIIGYIHFSGNYTQNADGQLFVNFSNGVWDQLLVNGTATLGGTLNASGFPTTGEGAFTILNAGNVTGTFAQVNLPAGCTIEYTATSVIIHAPPGVPCLGDINPDAGNGTVNIDDYTEVILNWGASGAAPQGDTDGDGVVNINDYTNVVLNWGDC